MEHEDFLDVLDNDNDTVSMEENEVEDVENKEAGDIEKPKGEDIYVENDISKLERMLGISSTEEEDSDEDEEEDSDEDDNSEDSDNLDADDHISGDLIEDEDLVKNDKQELAHIEPTKPVKPVLLSDFMDPIDTDSFTFLERNNSGYSLVSLDLKDKKAIQKAVRSPHYIFRYHKFALRDTVLGFSENKNDTVILYKVFFPEYSLSFVVSSDYQKPYSQSFKDYFEDLVTRIRPSDMKLEYYANSITITSLKVLETGLLEVDTPMGTEKYLINNNDINFYAVLDYIRTVSDQGVDKIKLSLIPEFFSRL